jgi:alpha-tubulin suppressor-like RCC1 family protein
LTNPSAIFANGNGTCVIDGGAAKCWGAKAGNVANQSSTPYLMPELASGVTSIGMGFDQSCAVANGGVKCWGSNGNGHIPGRPSDSNTPIAVAGLSGVTMLAVSSTHACAVASGVTKCWGTNASGQFGTGAVSGAKSAPVDVVGLLGQPSNITAGDGYTCANIGGSPYCWGANGSGQLGDGTTVQKTAPTKVIAIASMQKVVAGYNFTMAW